MVRKLDGLRKAPPPTAQWAGIALGQLGWLGDPVNAEAGPVGDLALDIQEDMAAASPLERDDQHWGESVIIAMGLYLTTLDAILLSEDYDARVGANRHGIASMSLTKLLWHMTLDSFRTHAQAEAYTQALVRSRRWTKQPAVSAADFASGRLGRMGRP